MINNYLPIRAEILEVKPQTEIDYTYRLKADIEVKSGQFVEVSIPRVGEAPLSVSDFGEGWIEITIRKVGKLTSVIHQLSAGNHLFIRGPYGNGFPIDKLAYKDIFIAVGGTGLAPVKSLINRYYRNPGEINSLTLLAGFKSPSDILFRNELEKWSKKLTLAVTVDRVDGSNWGGQVGLITDLINNLPAVNTKNSEVIIVGPPLMMKFASIAFLNKGIAPKKIWVSFERKMCCGIGKCGHCRINDTYVCLDGPVFNYTRAGELID